MVKYLEMADPERDLPADPDTSINRAFVLYQRFPRRAGRWHAHCKAQLMHAADTVMTVHTAQGLWVVPPHRGVWIPGGVEHRVEAARPHTFVSLYSDDDFAPPFGKCCVLELDSLLRALLDEAALFGDDYSEASPQYRLMLVIMDRLAAVPVAPLHLPRPRDERLVRMTEYLRGEVNSQLTLDALARRFGLSARTATRHFRRETGLTFPQWRQQLRLLEAMHKLGEGQSVTRVALEVGYHDVSSFIAVFRHFTGTTPARYFAGQDSGQKAGKKAMA